jgi:hypothetical protein
MYLEQAMSNMCPVCGYDSLFEPPWSGESASDEICPSCGFHFGYDDVIAIHPSRAEAYREWRERWISAGMPWFSRGRPAPPSWDPRLQLTRIASED